MYFNNDFTEIFSNQKNKYKSYYKDPSWLGCALTCRVEETSHSHVRQRGTERCCMPDHSAHSWTHPNSWWEPCSCARDLCPANSHCRQTDMRKCCTLHHSVGFQTWLDSCSTDISLTLSPAPSPLQLLMVEPIRNINLWVIHEFY